MPPRPLIHIGMPKCASTWLQRRFFLPQYGYARGISAAAAFFAFIAPGRYHFADWREARGMLKLDHGDKVPVISAEVLVGNPLTGGDNGETNLHRLHAAVPEARVLLIIREQQLMLRSLYKTLVNFGSPLPLKDHLFNDYAGAMPAFDPTYLFYDRIIRAYQHVFGAESVLVLPVEQFQREPRAFLERIGTFCEVDLSRYPPDADTSQRDNPNVTLLNLELKRLFNRFVARTRLSPGGLYKPRRLGEIGQFNVPAPAFVHRAMERRFAARVAYMTDGFYADSNAATQTLTGLDLRAYGYQLPGQPSSPGSAELTRSGS